MFTEPQIVFNPKSNSRAYVKVLINGDRHRFYNGSALGIRCFPNKAQNPKDKQRLLQKLQYELTKKLEAGWRPGPAETVNPLNTLTVKEAIEHVLAATAGEEISERYRKDMHRIGGQFLDYLGSKQWSWLRLQEITPAQLESFLDRFASSGTYYMTQRSNLAGIFTRLTAKGYLPENLVYKTSIRRRVPLLNGVFQKEQLKAVLAYLASHHEKLYLCALLMYGCFLRPHREIRLLQRQHMNEDCTQITLAGNENKSKRIRVIHLPLYVTEEIKRQSLHQFKAAEYLFTGTTIPCSPDYFKTIWTRLKRKLVKQGLIRKDQTLYSFRHTGAAAVYQKTKDPYKVQQVMFHSSLTVTLVYLRTLGLLIDNYLDDLPDL